MVRPSLLELTLGVSLFLSPTHALTFDAGEDFINPANPNGPWSYGWDDGSFHLIDLYIEVAPNIFFLQSGLLGPLLEPTIAKNNSSSVLVINGSTTYAPGDFALHPGKAGQRAVLRWTAPGNGDYSIAARFLGGDSLTTTDVMIRGNGTILAQGYVMGNSLPFTFFGQFSLLRNDTVDFSVGFGGNAYYFDTTKIDVIISSPPMSSLTPFPSPNTTGFPIINLNYDKSGPPGLSPQIIPPSPVPDLAGTLPLLSVGWIAMLAWKTWHVGRTRARVSP